MIATVSAIALLAMPALAQTPPQPGGLNSSPGVAAAPRAPSPNPLMAEDATKLKGVSVYGSDNKKIGEISAVLMKPENHTVDRLVVTAGGVLGIGGHPVALPIDDFKWDGNSDAFKISKTTEDLKAMPEWKQQASAAGMTPSSSSTTSSSRPMPGVTPSPGGAAPSAGGTTPTAPSTSQ
jgi:hypothetical protein